MCFSACISQVLLFLRSPADSRSVFGCRWFSVCGDGAGEAEGCLPHRRVRESRRRLQFLVLRVRDFGDVAVLVRGISAASGA